MVNSKKYLVDVVGNVGGVQQNALWQEQELPTHLLCKYEVYKSRFSCKACRSYWVTQYLMRGRLEFQEDLFSYARQHGIMAGLTLGMQTRLFQSLFHSHIFTLSLSFSFLNLSLLYQPLFAHSPFFSSHTLPYSSSLSLNIFLEYN